MSSNSAALRLPREGVWLCFSAFLSGHGFCAPHHLVGAQEIAAIYAAGAFGKCKDGF
jgi:hypothetical protein